MLTEQELIKRYISDEKTSDPHRRNEPVIKEKGTPVRAVAEYCIQATAGNVLETAKAYKLTSDEVEAALAYYHQHKKEMEIWVNGEKRVI